MRVRINGKKWTIQDAEIHGLCWVADRIIDIDPRSGSRRRLRVLIHEVLHALHPKWSEKRVERDSRVLRKILEKDGWRRHKKGR